MENCKVKEEKVKNFISGRFYLIGDDEFLFLRSREGEGFFYSGRFSKIHEDLIIFSGVNVQEIVIT